MAAAAAAHSQHVLHVSPLDSKALYPKNNATEFYVQLPYALDLPGRWECALLAATVRPKWQKANEIVILCCDALNDSYCYGSMCQILQEINHRDFKGGRCLYLNPIYRDVQVQSAKRLRFSLKGGALEPSEELTLTLRFRQK